MKSYEYICMYSSRYIQILVTIARSF